MCTGRTRSGGRERSVIRGLTVGMKPLETAGQSEGSSLVPEEEASCFFYCPNGVKGKVRAAMEEEGLREIPLI